MSDDLRGRVVEALIADGWDGHEDGLTVADLRAIADALLPLIAAERDEAARQAAEKAWEAIAVRIERACVGSPLGRPCRPCRDAASLARQTGGE